MNWHPYDSFICLPSSMTRLGNIFALWATFQSLWQQLFLPTFQAIFVEVSKSFIFRVESFLGNFQTFGNFLLVTLLPRYLQSPFSGMHYCPPMGCGVADLEMTQPTKKQRLNSRNKGHFLVSATVECFIRLATELVGTV